MKMDFLYKKEPSSIIKHKIKLEFDDIPNRGTCEIVNGLLVSNHFTFKILSPLVLRFNQFQHNFKFAASLILERSLMVHHS